MFRYTAVPLGDDSALILAQAAFELLAWTFFVEDRKSISRSNFKKTGAAERNLLALLNTVGIPTAIPSSLEALTGLASQLNAKNGPASLISIRNAFVHSTNESQKNLRSLRHGHSLRLLS